MLAKLKSLLDATFDTSNPQDPAALEQQLQLASAVLLIEVARTDHQIDDEELNKVRSSIQSCFSLSSEAADALVEDADAKVHEIIDFHQFTTRINDAFSVEQKCRLIEYMWQVALADGNLDAYEDQFIRKISDLLYLRHSELIAARERAKSNRR